MIYKLVYPWGPQLGPHSDKSPHESVCIQVQDADGESVHTGAI